MSIRVALYHKTVYHYDRLVTLSPQMIRLRPAPHCRIPIESYSLRVLPAEQFINWQQDPQGNFVARVVFPKKTDIFSVEVDLVAEIVVINPFDFFLEPDAEEYPFTYDAWLTKELAPFRECEPVGPLLRSFIDSVDVRKRRTVDFLVDLNQKLQHKIKYLVRLEPGIQTCEQTLTLASGSCRDSAWLMVQVLRNLGLAARFVSGYLIQLKPDVKPLEGPAGTDHDFTDLHAWTEVYLPGAGWVGLDATSGLFAGEGHIPLAATPDPVSAAPIAGGVDESQVEFDFEMQVTRLHEDPRVTKPYTDQQWTDIQALGHQIDRDLVSGDVRLTMGGEPTFVSVDDMDGPEWNTTALGEHKRRLAGQLIERLRDRFAPGAFLHYGQGKWYPGESLPRWALTCYWRTDGVPLWENKQLLARENAPGTFGQRDASRFMVALSRRLGVDPAYARPAFEDPWHFMAKEHKLPVNVDALDSRLEDAEERERLRRVFDRGLNTPVGYVLPIQRGLGKDGRQWQSGLWMLRSKHLVLVPGDSPIGLRLPLASLPWVAPSETPRLYPTDPLAPRDPLPIPERRFRQAEVERKSDRREERGEIVEQVLQEEPDERSPRPGESASWVVRTAMCIEARQGRVHVFMPPVSTLEDYVDMLAAVEDTAAELSIPVVIEGYTPPHDYRIQHIKVTPDPGVIEVNVHPAHSWDEVVKNTTALYEDAHATRLGTEKFMIDGRHTGTGGGNHVVIGGATPADSPFLRRPDVLRSLIGYWLNHPSLSYLFSGMFVGPTSQAPRVDETRQDSIYELEIAFGQVPNPGQWYCPPWLVDRIFRHLLVDVSGNTHRAEFCIDKLYSPGSATGRLGLLEFRAFEMPPHAQMSCTQQLLLRAIIAWFWREPFLARPMQWGTQLHDRYMLPHFVSHDFDDVLADLGRAGYPFPREWFAPHFEFRFPVFGRVNHQGIDLEVRQAIEPWYVLGEEGAVGGTARYVDSSVERVQVKTAGLLGERYVVTCNGRRIPMTPTGTHGAYVAGVRYRAWQPPSCLHPTIPVHTPLIFDIVDTWSSRSIGGCTYHVAHPGGRSHDTFPVNSNEAEARRVARFLGFGHTPGLMSVPPAETNPQFPLTLDLRRAPG